MITVFENGRIRTMDPRHPIAHSFATAAGRIIAIDDAALALAPHAAQRIDLGGRWAVPGFNDVHHHLSMRGMRLRGIDLRAQTVADRAAALEAVRTAAERAEPGSWLYGSGYNQTKLDGGHLTARELDAVAPRNPVWIEHVSGHMGVGNSLAFERAGYPGRRGVPDIDGGIVARESDDGRLAAGLLQEKAMELIVSVFKPIPVDEIVESIRVGSDAALSEGITSITEPGIGTVNGIGNSPLDLHAFHTARERGALRVRAQVMPYVTALRELSGAEGEHGYGLDLGLRSGFGDEWLRIGPVKLLSDGSLVGRSAAMSCCYQGHDDAGILLWDDEELERLLTGAHRLGFRLATHAIGDRAIEFLLDFYSRLDASLPVADARHRIEHLSVATDAQVRRAADLGLIPVPQGRFISELGDAVAEVMGPERTRLAYRGRSLLDAGMHVPGSSDAPVVDGSPILGIHDLVNRRTAGGADFVPEERVTAEQALRMYTVGSAYASFDEHDKGTIEVGKLADVTVLSDDLLSVDPERIDEVRVEATIVGGEFGFDAAGIGGAA